MGVGVSGSVYWGVNKGVYSKDGSADLIKIMIDDGSDLCSSGGFFWWFKCVCVMFTGLYNGKYDLLLRCCSVKFGQGVATVLDNVASDYNLL